MTVNLLFFSVFRDITGCSEMTLNLPPHSKIQDLVEALSLQFPAFTDWQASLLVAVNQTYAKWDHALASGDEVALMPPVQGG